MSTAPGSTSIIDLDDEATLLPESDPDRCAQYPLTQQEEQMGSNPPPGKNSATFKYKIYKLLKPTGSKKRKSTSPCPMRKQVQVMPGVPEETITVLKMAQDKAVKETRDFISTLSLTSSDALQWKKFDLYFQTLNMPWQSIVDAVSSVFPLLLTHQLRSSQPLSSEPLETACDLFSYKICLPSGAAATVTSLYNAWKQQSPPSEQQADDTGRTQSLLPATTTSQDYHTSMSTTAAVTPRVGVVAPLCATSLFVPNIDAVIGPQTSTSMTGCLLYTSRCV